MTTIILNKRIIGCSSILLLIVEINPNEIGITKSESLVESNLSTWPRCSVYIKLTKYMRYMDEKKSTFLYGYLYFRFLIKRKIDTKKRKITGIPFSLFGNNGKSENRPKAAYSTLERDSSFIIFSFFWVNWQLFA